MAFRKLLRMYMKLLIRLSVERTWKMGVIVKNMYQQVGVIHRKAKVQKMKFSRKVTSNEKTFFYYVGCKRKKKRGLGFSRIITGDREWTISSTPTLLWTS